MRPPPHRLRGPAIHLGDLMYLHCMVVRDGGIYLERHALQGDKQERANTLGPPDIRQTRAAELPLHQATGSKCHEIACSPQALKNRRRPELALPRRRHHRFRLERPGSAAEEVVHALREVMPEAHRSTRKIERHPPARPAGGTRFSLAPHPRRGLPRTPLAGSSRFTVR